MKVNRLIPFLLLILAVDVSKAGDEGINDWTREAWDNVIYPGEEEKEYIVNYQWNYDQQWDAERVYHQEDTKEGSDLPAHATFMLGLYRDYAQNNPVTFIKIITFDHRALRSEFSENIIAYGNHGMSWGGMFYYFRNNADFVAEVGRKAIHKLVEADDATTILEIENSFQRLARNQTAEVARDAVNRNLGFKWTLDAANKILSTYAKVMDSTYKEDDLSALELAEQAGWESDSDEDKSKAYSLLKKYESSNPDDLRIKILDAQIGIIDEAVDSANKRLSEIDGEINRKKNVLRDRQEKVASEQNKIARLSASGDDPVMLESIRTKWLPEARGGVSAATRDLDTSMEAKRRMSEKKRQMLEEKQKLRSEKAQLSAPMAARDTATQISEGVKAALREFFTQFKEAFEGMQREMVLIKQSLMQGGQGSTSTSTSDSGSTSTGGSGAGTSIGAGVSDSIDYGDW